MAVKLKITPSGRIVLCGHHNSTGVLVFAEVGEIPEFLKLPLRGSVGELKQAIEVTFVNRTLLFIKAGSVGTTKVTVTEDLLLTLKGDLFSAARRLGVAIPRMRPLMEAGFGFPA